jgi:hypothetical protein
MRTLLTVNVYKLFESITLPHRREEDEYYNAFAEGLAKELDGIFARFIAARRKYIIMANSGVQLITLAQLLDAIFETTGFVISTGENGILMNLDENEQIFPDPVMILETGETYTEASLDFVYDIDEQSENLTYKIICPAGVDKAEVKKVLDAYRKAGTKYTIL